MLIQPEVEKRYDATTQRVETLAKELKAVIAHETFSQSDSLIDQAARLIAEIEYRRGQVHALEAVLEYED